MNIYILGYNSFIAKHLYILLKRKYSNIFLISYNQDYPFSNLRGEDVIINCCGVNRGKTEEEYNTGNFTFIQNLFDKLKGNKELPYMLHFSSLMVYGFENTPFESLPDYQRWFINSKLNAEFFLLNNYEKSRLCIVRPSNIFGYDCKPYYNNLLCTLIYEKIKGIEEEKKINANCYRNMLSVDSLSKKILEYVDNRTYGIFDIMSNNTLSLEEMLNNIYDKCIPDNIKITKETSSVPNFTRDDIPGDSVVINENFFLLVKGLEKDMGTYIKLVNNVPIEKRKSLSQPRGEMVEITNLNSKRLYKITINKNSVRGNHYHFEQIEDFYINSGSVLFVLAFSYEPDIIYIFTSHTNDLVRINPNVIHTVANDFVDNISEIIISSTQEHIPSEIPDTKYINLI